MHDLSEEELKKIDEEFSVCQECGKTLDRDNNEYQRTWGTCDSHCYGKLVGVYI